MREEQIAKNYTELKNQDLVADKLSISQQAVSNALRKIKWKEIKLIETDLNNALTFYNNCVQHKETLDKEDLG
jgi:DNA-binding transcriptional regulator LsrR (DeoR family)